MLAVDNGNIEIYDRYSMKMTCLLVGQYSASPVKIDFNSNLIFVQYTCAFWRRRQSPSSWWNIYCRYLFSLVFFFVNEMECLKNSTAIYSFEKIPTVEVKTYQRWNAAYSTFLKRVCFNLSDRNFVRHLDKCFF